MTKLEKVIKGLENCASRSFDGCMCEWYDEETGDCFSRLAVDALELLKEQEARVLTLEEVLKANPVWFETHGLLLPAIIDHEESKAGDCVIVFGEFDGSYYPINRYNKTWRCWTARPTDEQRMAAKWG